MSGINIPALMLAAAKGDADAQHALAEEGRRCVIEGSVDVLFGSMEGIAYARMAALNGRVDALHLLAQHIRALSRYCASVGAEEMAADHYGHAMAIMDILADRLPTEEADAVRLEIDAAAERNTAEVLRAAQFHRDQWAALLGPEAVR